VVIGVFSVEKLAGSINENYRLTISYTNPQEPSGSTLQEGFVYEELPLFSGAQPRTREPQATARPACSYVARSMADSGFESAILVIRFLN